MDHDAHRLTFAPSMATWVLLVGALAYVLFVREYALPAVEVPCRAFDGRVWAYELSSRGQWTPSRHELGDEAQRQSRNPGTPKALDCNPRAITRPDLELLENGVVESVVLVEDGAGWKFVVRDELRGIYTYRFQYHDGRVLPRGAARKLINLPAYGAFWVIAFGALALIVKRSARRRRP